MNKKLLILFLTAVLFGATPAYSDAGSIKSTGGANSVQAIKTESQEVQSTENTATSQTTEPTAAEGEEKPSEPKLVPFKSLIFKMVKALGAALGIVALVFGGIMLLKRKRAPKVNAVQGFENEEIIENPQNLSHAVAGFVKHKLR